MIKTLAAFGAAALLVGGLTTAAAPANASVYPAPSCGVTWGSLPKTDADMSSATVTNVRAGRHECFDRLVIDLSGRLAGYHVQYVDAVVQDGSGLPVPLAGGAYLSVTATAPAHDENYRPTYTPADRANLVDVTCFSTFRQVAWAGTFEGRTTIGLGVRARLPFRTFILEGGPGGGSGGSRLIVDVAHRW